MTIPGGGIAECYGQARYPQRAIGDMGGHPPLRAAGTPSSTVTVTPAAHDRL